MSRALVPWALRIVRSRPSSRIPYDSGLVKLPQCRGASQVHVQPKPPSSAGQAGQNPKLVPNTYFPFEDETTSSSSSPPPPPPPPRHPSYFPPPPQQPPNAQSPPSPSRSRWRNVRTLIYILTFSATGYVTAGIFVDVFLPTRLPEPGSVEDVLLRSQISAKAEKLEILDQLSSSESWALVPATLGPGHEISTPSSASSSATAGDTGDSSSPGFASGARGLTYEYRFAHLHHETAVDVVYVGGALTGFPRIAHGGALSILLADACECTLNHYILSQDAQDAEGSQKAELRGLELTYRRPTRAKQFVTVITHVDREAASDGGVVRAKVQNQLGEICIEATARYDIRQTDPALTETPGAEDEKRERILHALTKEAS